MATEIVLPMLGITVERGKIVEWLKEEGDPVEKGEIIFIVEVEKATTEVEASASGVLAKIIVDVGIEVPVLTVVGVITAPGETLPDDYEPPAVEGSPAEAEEAAPVDGVISATLPAPGCVFRLGRPAIRRAFTPRRRPPSAISCGNACP